MQLELATIQKYRCAVSHTTVPCVFVVVCIDWPKRKPDRTMPEAATSAAAQHTPGAVDHEDDDDVVSPARPAGSGSDYYMQVESEDLPEEMSMKYRFSRQQLLQNMSPSA